MGRKSSGTCFTGSGKACCSIFHPVSHTVSTPLLPPHPPTQAVQDVTKASIVTGERTAGDMAVCECAQCTHTLSRSFPPLASASPHTCTQPQRSPGVSLSPPACDPTLALLICPLGWSLGLRTELRPAPLLRPPVALHLQGEDGRHARRQWQVMLQVEARGGLGGAEVSRSEGARLRRGAGVVDLCALKQGPIRGLWYVQSAIKRVPNC